MPLVKLLNTIVVGVPGDKVIAFGHSFTIEPDGTCVCDMHPDFIPTEVAAGRIKVLDEDIQEQINDVVNPMERKDDDIDRGSQTLAKFGFNIDDYFGLQNESLLMSALAGLVKSDIREFAKTRIRIQFPARHTADQMLSEIKETVALAHKRKNA